MNFFISLEPVLGTNAISSDPVQMPQYAASDQVYTIFLQEFLC